MTLEIHGHRIHGKGDTNNPNECKYNGHLHKKSLYFPICKYCFRWSFDQGFLASKEFLIVIVIAVFIWTKWIVDEVISMYIAQKAV